ncbi:hypothetical protein TNCV_3922771 [Trichonephila clavipes]|nr:hypothetical protein TNCV_3922771 [Trichonephila clavipes]
MAQHRPRKPASVEYTTDEEDTIVYDMGEEIESPKNGSTVGASKKILRNIHRDRIVGDTVDVIEEMDGKSCTLDEDDLVTAGEESEIFCLVEDERGGSKFKGGHLILVMFSSFCVVTDIGEGLIACAYVWGS